MMTLFKNLTVGNPKKMVKPIFWTACANLANILPFGLMALVVSMIYQHFADTNVPLDMKPLWLAAAGMALALLILYLFETLSYRACYRDSYSSSTDGRAKLAEHLRKLPLGFLMSRDSGAISSTMTNDFTQIEEGAAHCLPQVIAGCIVPVTAAAFMSIMDWRMAVAMFAGFPVAVLIIWSINGLERRWGESHSKARVEMSNRLGEYLFGMKVIKAYNLRGENFTKLERAFHQFMKESTRLEGGLGPFFLVAIAFLKTGISLITIIGVYLILGGEITVPLFALFLLAGTRIFDPLAVAVVKLGELKYHNLAGERIMNIMNEPVMTGENEAPERHDILFENVTFGYGKNIVLDHVTVEMKEETLTAIVGPSGSGKSTMLRLISRFYDPQNGRVLFGGFDERGMNPEKLMKKISVVFQDVYLFQDTIRNNIRYGREDADQEDIEQAARDALCHDFIMELPKGYDTMVGEGGSTLSGGEKQRISIARAMLKNAPVILLDEATSSLDPENEVEMQKAIGRLVRGRTVVMIAHRLKTVARADNIIVLDKGKVAEQGQHEELIKRGGLYAKLWGLQAKTGGWKISA
jgi:ATP-binding cassette subfamily B protein IrtB